MNESSNILSPMEWRCIGPYRGGRVVAVAGDPYEANVFYFGACSGGVWKSTDGGVYWGNVSDGFFGTSSVGAIAVAESDSNIVYAGTGEACIRGNLSHGDGVYKSTDAGETWTHVGLKDTRHIARVRIHPDNPNIVYVAALGHAFGANSERGVFRSKDGGVTWEKILFRSENAGAIDISLDSNNPRIIYASIWEVIRSPWSLSSGGTDSGLYKSTDGGDTWTELTNKPGMPLGLKGRIGVAVSPARPGRVWAIIESGNGGLFRTDDGGDTWNNVCAKRELTQRPWYYHHVFAHPKDPETVWVLNLQAWVSVDGGHNFERMATAHADNHDLWVDPRNPERIIEGNDGGARVSFNGGRSWSSIENQPTGQFYHVATDNQFPYRVYGTQQDNTAISVPSRTNKEAITWGDCYAVGFSESGYITVRPDDSNIVYSGAVGSAPGGGGSLLRYDHRSGQTRIITVWPEVYGGWGAKDLKYRFQWTYPIVISPHDPNVLYVAGNRLFKSDDEGTSWDIISPDLTRNDVSKLDPSGGSITRDTTGAEHYCTIFSFVESPHKPGVFWVGSDDGLIHISFDNGESWNDVTPPELPEWATINLIEVSPHDPGTAYVAATRYKLDDYRPLLYKTNDYGRNWVSIATGILTSDITRVIREDPVRKGLLYVGTETGIYFSLNDGEIWQSLQLNLPIVPVHDLVINKNDLIVATHGRAFWILDDLSLIRQLNGDVINSSIHLFSPQPVYFGRINFETDEPLVTGNNYQLVNGVNTTFVQRKMPDGRVVYKFIDAGQNPVDGLKVIYWFKTVPDGEVNIIFLDSNGKIIRSFSSESLYKQDSIDLRYSSRVSVCAGMNSFIWDMRHEPTQKLFNDSYDPKTFPGPLVPPGRYRVQILTEDNVCEAFFDILRNPNVPSTQLDLENQFEFLIQIRDKISHTNDVINKLRNVRRQVENLLEIAELKNTESSIRDLGTKILRVLDSIEEELIQTKPIDEYVSDVFHFEVKLHNKLTALVDAISNSDSLPTVQSYEVFQYLSDLIDKQIELFRNVVDEDIKEFVSDLKDLGVPIIVPKVFPW